MEFILGCNYWASNAGADMWRNFDIECIKKDLKTLSDHGVKYMRVFPNWREFQPVIPQMAYSGDIVAYQTDYNIKADNPYYLDEKMLERFSEFLDVCQQHDIKLIVGLLTGWMSGGLFIPSALYGKNLITDPLALYFEQLFIKGFIERFRDRKCIFAWDLGNECNCLSPTPDRWAAANWTSIIANAIRSADPYRMVVSGMHSLETEGKWTLYDQGMLTDMLTTHPYPLWSNHTRTDEILSLKTTSHATAQAKFYAEIGKRPCLTEEIGTMGPMFCSDKAATDFLRLNMFSLWANGSTGVMWWCSSDQTELSTFPYTDQMVEVELGMMNVSGEPKPVLKEMKKFADFLSSFCTELPKAKKDAVCILTRNQKQWGVAYINHILSRQAGFNCEFCYGDDEIPNSEIYMMPSISGYQIMHKKNYEKLLKKVYEGASLYISIDTGTLYRFEELTGLKIRDSFDSPKGSTTEIDGKTLSILKSRNFLTESVGARVIYNDSNGIPFITVNNYGKGKVFVVNGPIEDNLVNRNNAFSEPYDLIYRRFLNEIGYIPTVSVDGKEIALTYHPSDKENFVVLINHSGIDKSFNLKMRQGYVLDKVYYGNLNKIKAFDACILTIKKEGCM